MLTFYDAMQNLTDYIFGTPAPDSNEALRRYLIRNPDATIDSYLLLTHKNEPHNHTHTEAQRDSD